MSYGEFNNLNSIKTKYFNAYIWRTGNLTNATIICSTVFWLWFIDNKIALKFLFGLFADEETGSLEGGHTHILPQTGGTEGSARLYQESSIMNLLSLKCSEYSVQLFVSCRVE